MSHKVLENMHLECDECHTVRNEPFCKVCHTFDSEVFINLRHDGIDAAADIDADSWGQVFLKYIMGHPAVTIPIPGTSKPHHAEDNAGALYGRLPDTALRNEMERHFDELA